MKSWSKVNFPWQSKGQFNPYYWPIRLFRERVLPSSIAQIPLRLQMILRSAIVLLDVIELGANSHLRFPRVNKRVDRFNRKISTIRDYFWYSQARPIRATVGENKTLSIQINIWLSSCFHFQSFPNSHAWVASEGMVPTNPSIWGEKTNKQTKVDWRWMKAHAALPICDIQPTSTERCALYSTLWYATHTQ